MKQALIKSSIPGNPSEVSGVNRRSFLTKASVGALALLPFSALADGSRDHEDGKAIRPEAGGARDHYPLDSIWRAQCRMIPT